MRLAAALLALRPRLGCAVADPLCAGCVAGRCASCVGGYADPQGGLCVRPRVPVAHCLVYAAEAQCRTCQLGYAPADGGCQPIAAKDCLALADDGRCRVCALGRAVGADGQCAGGGYCLLPRCDYCENSLGFETCLACRGGYAVSRALDRFGVCERAPAAAPDCMVSDGQRCLFCAVGHYALGDGCPRSAAHALTLVARSALQKALLAAAWLLLSG